MTDTPASQPSGAAQPSRPLRVLHVISGLGLGGAEAMLFRVVTHPSTVEHRVVCLSGPDWYSRELQRCGVEVEHLNINAGSNGLAATARLFRLIRRSGADVVQGWMYRSNLLAALAAKTKGIPSVWGIHNSSLEPLSFRAKLWVYASGAVAGWAPSYVINCSNRSARLHEALGFGRAPGRVVHNGHQSEIFFPDEAVRARVRGELGIGPGTFLLGSVARWHVQKDHPNLLAAMRILKERGVTDFKCLFVGHEMNEENGAMVEAIAREGLQQSVIALGPRGDVPDIMRALDVHVLASCGGEAFPNVVAEAMLCGTPCVVTDVGDAAFMVEQNGWVAPPRDPAALASGIEAACRQFRDDPAGWAARCAAARERIASRFTLEAMAREYEAIWREVAKRPAA